MDGLGLKPRVAYGPVRVAVTGGDVLPPLFESIALLGRERTLERLGRRGLVWGQLRAWANIDSRRAGQVGALNGVWGNWQPDGFWFR